MSTSSKHEQPISGYTSQGALVRTMAIRSPSGTRAEILTLGARLHDIILPDNTSVILSHSTLSDVVTDGAFINGVIGRTANRLANGRLSRYKDMNDVHLQLNDGGVNTLHGGVQSWDRRLFGVDDITDHAVQLSMVSVDGDCGFPSAVNVSVKFEFTDSEELTISLITKNIGLRRTVTNMTVSLIIITSPPFLFYFVCVRDDILTCCEYIVAYLFRPYWK